MDISVDVKNNAVDLLATMAAEELAMEQSMTNEEALTCILSSNTGKLLYDEKYKFWWEGPSAIAELVSAELKSNRVS